MNRLALSVCFLGVVSTGYTPLLLHANHDGLAPEAQSVALRAARLDAASAAARPENPQAVTVAVWSPPSRPDATTTFAAPLGEDEANAPSEAIYAESLPSSYDGGYDEPVWAVVTRGARLHADASVSSPTVWFYPVGAELHVTGYRHGWYEIVDPATWRRGWIYANYYLDALRGPDEARTIVAQAKVPLQIALAEPATAEPARRVKRPKVERPQARAARTLPVATQARPTIRSPETVASLLERAFRR